MKPQHDFIAERPLAQHCAELLPAAPGMEHLLADFSEAGFNIARELRPVLSPLLGGAELSITCGSSEAVTLDDFIAQTGTQSVNSVLAMQGGGSALLATVSLEAVLALTDRVFGGTGEVPEPLPDTLPMSADLALRKLEAALCHALGRSVAAETPPIPDRRGSDIAKLNPFCGSKDLVKLVLTITQDDQPGWDICFSASAADPGEIFKAGPGGAKPSMAGIHNNPLAAPFGNVPLPIEAVLAEMNLPISRVSQLAVGDTFPIPVAREIPLRIGAITIGHGTVGAVDGRVAIQLTRAMRPAASDISKETY